MVKEGLRLNVLDLTCDICLEMYVLKFPERLLNEIEKLKNDSMNKAKSSKAYKNLRLSRLNVLIEGILNGCYANYVNKNNIECGWIFSYTNSNLDAIKHFLTLWAIDGGVDELIVKDILNDVVYEKKNINISYTDILNKRVIAKEGEPNNYLKQNLLLFYIGNNISNKVKYSITCADGKIKTLTFKKVNVMESNGSLRLMSEVLTYESIRLNKKTNEKITVYESYAYFIDIALENIYDCTYPKLFINSGLVRFRTKPNKFATRGSKAIHPYIEISPDICVDSNYATYIKGKVFPKARAWDSLFEQCFNYTYSKLPKISDVFESPEKYIENNNIKVLVPHGTHFWDAKHDILQGSDLYSRAEIAEVIKECICSIMPGMCNNDFNYVEKREKRSKKNTHTQLTEIDIPGNEINIEVYYMNDEFKSEFAKLIDVYNSGRVIKPLPKELSKEEKAEAKKLNDPIVSVTDKIHQILQPIEYDNAIKLGQETVNNIVKINVCYVNILKDMNLNLAIEDKIKKMNIKAAKVKEDNSVSKQDEELVQNKMDAEKKKALRLIEKELNKNNKAFKCIQNSNEVICAIVEFPNAEFFASKDLIDLKNYMRHNFAINNRVTQFIASGLTKKNDVIENSNYNRMGKCILECLRMKGIVVIDVDKTFEYLGIDKKNAIIGLYLIPGTEEFILTALYQKKLYSYVIGMSNKWTSYDNILVELGSVIDKKVKVNADGIELALHKFVEQFGADHLMILANRTALKKKVPYFIDMKSELNLCIKYKDDNMFEVKKLNSALAERLTIVAVDEEYSGVCPEWVSVVKGEEDKKGLPNSFYKLNDYVFYGIAPKTNASDMKSLTKYRKEERLNKIFRKETAIMYTVPIVKTGYSNEFAARISHGLRSMSSFQYDDKEYTALPYVLHLSKKTKEYSFKKSELIYNEDKQEEMEAEDFNIINVVSSDVESDDDSLDLNKNTSNILEDILDATISW